MKRSALGAWLMGLLLAAGAVWFYLNFERVTEREQVGYQGEARRNPYLAAMRLIERMGMKTRELHQLNELERLPRGGTLVLARRRAGLSRGQAERMLAWVHDGGHLIVEAEDHRSPDLLLDSLKVMRRELKLKPPARPSEIRLPDAPAPLQVRFEYRQDLIDLGRSAAAVVKDEWSILLLEYGRGNGRVTVLNGFSFMTNRTIGRNDHAEFVWRLVQQNRSAPEVSIAAWLESPSLSAWLLDHAWQALATAALLLALWLWRVAPRFGPLEPDPLPQRRRLLDHLRASGIFYWKAGAAPRLLAAARESCLRKIARTHPGVVELPPAQRVERFAALTQLAPHELELALGGTAADPRQFTAAIRTLQAMEERLTRTTKM